MLIICTHIFSCHRRPCEMRRCRCLLKGCPSFRLQSQCSWCYDCRWTGRLASQPVVVAPYPTGTFLGTSWDWRWISRHLGQRKCQSTGWEPRQDRNDNKGLGCRHSQKAKGLYTRMGLRFGYWSFERSRNFSRSNVESRQWLDCYVYISQVKWIALVMFVLVSCHILLPTSYVGGCPYAT